jgi:hypothetical protein
MPAQLKRPIPGCNAGKGPSVRVEVPCDCASASASAPTEANSLPVSLRVNPANHCEYTFIVPSVHGCPVGWCALSEAERTKQASGGASGAVTRASDSGGDSSGGLGGGGAGADVGDDGEQGGSLIVSLMVTAIVLSLLYLCGACCMHYRDFGKRFELLFCMY